jgi:hypothetical protein
MSKELTDPSISDIADSAVKPSHPMHVVDEDDTTATADGTSKRITLEQIRLGALSIGIVTPAGTTQGTATLLADYENIVDTVSSATHGVVMSSSAKNFSQTIENNGTLDFNVYPKLGAAFLGLATNAPIVISPGNKYRLRIATANIVRYL